MDKGDNVANILKSNGKVSDSHQRLAKNINRRSPRRILYRSSYQGCSYLHNSYYVNAGNGRRMASQLSRIEMAAMVSLAAAIGVPLQDPERGLLPVIVIAIIVISVERLISLLASKNERFEDMTQDDLDVLVEDSVLKMDRMKRTRITKDRLCAQLRSESLVHLGSVKRLYLEANGGFSLIKEGDPKPGLNILPSWDKEFINELQVTDVEVCSICGKKRSPEDQDNKCSNCGNSGWERAVSE